MHKYYCQIAALPELTFDPESEQFNLLPSYLQRFSAKFWQKKSDPEILEMSLLDEYYLYLRQSGNGFVEKWAALEWNLINYLTAKKCEEFTISKQDQLVGSGDFVNRLFEFQTINKEIQVEWPLASVIDKICENDLNKMEGIFLEWGARTYLLDAEKKMDFRAQCISVS